MARPVTLGLVQTQPVLGDQTANLEQVLNLTADAEKKLQAMHGINEIDVAAANAEFLMEQSEPGLTTEEMEKALEQHKKLEALRQRIAETQGVLSQVPLDKVREAFPELAEIPSHAITEDMLVEIM